MLEMVGSKVSTNEFGTSIECEEWLGVYPVEVQYTEDAEVEYVASSDPTGYLLVYRDKDGVIHSVYMDNTVGTSCLADLL